MYKITKLEVEKPYKLKVSYSNGRTVKFEAESSVKMGGVFAELADSRRFGARRVHDRRKG